jgi:drug/metabolite transporter (DMT)-like permease
MANSLIALFFLGCIPTLIKLTHADIVTIGLARLLLAVVLYWVYTQIAGKKIRYTKENIIPCLSIGVCFGFHWLCYFLSIRLSTVAVAAFCMATNGIFMLFLSRFFFQEHLSITDVFALLLTLLGSFLVMPPFVLGSQMLLGFGIGMLNALLFAITALLQKKYAASIPNQTRTFSQYAFALPIFLFLLPRTNWQLATQDWVILAVLGILCTFIAHTLWIKSIESLPAKTTAILYYLSTVFAVIFAAVFLGEMPSLRVLMGGVLIIGGSVLALRVKKEMPVELVSLE